MRRRADLVRRLAVDEDAFDRVLSGARALSAEHATILADMTGVSSLVFESLENSFSQWCEILQQSSRAYDYFGQVRLNIYFTAEEVSRRVAALALEMGELLKPEDPRDGERAQFVIIPLLRGAFIFAADLYRYLFVLGMDADVEFMEINSYNEANYKSTTPRVIKDASPRAVEGRTAIIIDDICHTGETLSLVSRRLTALGASKVLSCVLIDKVQERSEQYANEAPTYVGFTVGANTGWMSGYGMDQRGRMRGLRHVGQVLTPAI
jgi:hypoxanthine phosphoribosyltransferase